ncbi:MAG: hypothetical protein V4717_02990 [Bacteroidota bacterium]
MKKPLLVLISLFCFTEFCFTQNTGIGTYYPTATLDVNGTIRIRGGNPGAGKIPVSDANGVISFKQRRVGFRAKGIESLGAANIANNTWYRLYLKEKSYDYGNDFNLSPLDQNRSKFTAPATGLYHYSANVVFATTSSFNDYTNLAIRLVITRNGITSYYSQKYMWTDPSEMRTVPFSMDDDIRLLTGDMIWIEVRQENDEEANQPLDASVETASFACHLVFEE